MEETVRDTDSVARRQPQRVQVIERAFGLLDDLVQFNGSATAGELKAASGLAGPTVHRLLHTLIGLGVVHQLPDKRYALGAHLVPLGEGATRQLGGLAVPQMQSLVAELGESVNMAAMESEMVVYIAQVPSPHSMRMFTEVGRRAYMHSTGVGKAMLATMYPQRVREVLASTGMPAMTPKTLTRPDALLEQLPIISRQRYALDDEEQEIGVRCLAVSIPHGPTRMGLSVSGPTARMDDAFVRHAVPLMNRTATEIGRKLLRR
ncbi:IclR family transcriptional regulator [Nesterenkonia sphaerica]|uniref:IclR family transcriptional regulator n=1 Tax=Nesterenkonia sphaerica TaxID=1804988 RepID=A0A5R9A684_9MICC|nr:IclR family transcriptional regulator [Nesterenkonia sphaerica]TLP74040.1 IclR family transcriptional regulator [Nesterenkonia sphaerica]